MSHKGVRPPIRWKGKALKDLQACYEQAMPWRELTDKFHTSSATVTALALRHGWVRDPIAIAKRVREIDQRISALTKHLESLRRAMKRVQYERQSLIQAAVALRVNDATWKDPERRASRLVNMTAARRARMQPAGASA